MHMAERLLLVRRNGTCPAPYRGRVAIALTQPRFNVHHQMTEAVFLYKLRTHGLFDVQSAWLVPAKLGLYQCKRERERLPDEQRCTELPLATEKKSEGGNTRRQTF